MNHNIVNISSQGIYLPILGSLSSPEYSSGLLKQAIGTVLLSWAIVLSGSGDVEVLKHCRYYATLNSKVINYGLELAIHEAIGILFLGGCQVGFHIAQILRPNSSKYGFARIWLQYSTLGGTSVTQSPIGFD